jgi:hypothetical protein
MYGTYFLSAEYEIFNTSMRIVTEMYFIVGFIGSFDC